jgi:rhodanese-related sulfurtransferase
MFSFIKNLFGPATDYNALLEKGAVIIDVRTAGEYANGHIKGSKNIPLDIINGRVAELKKASKPVITVCRSGARSGMAKGILASGGIEVYNGGPWNSLMQKIN